MKQQLPCTNCFVFFAFSNWLQANDMYGDWNTRSLDAFSTNLNTQIENKAHIYHRFILETMIHFVYVYAVYAQLGGECKRAHVDLLWLIY